MAISRALRMLTGVTLTMKRGQVEECRGGESRDKQVLPAGRTG